ncbi:MAG: hypothetical protein R3Y65_00635 [Bacillota bacterium]
MKEKITNEIYCPNCGVKLHGTPLEKNNVKYHCRRCGVKILSKLKSAKKADLHIELIK